MGVVLVPEEKLCQVITPTQFPSMTSKLMNPSSSAVQQQKKISPSRTTRLYTVSIHWKSPGGVLSLPLILIIFLLHPKVYWQQRWVQRRRNNRFKQQWTSS